MTDKTTGLGAALYIDSIDMTDDYASVDTLSKSIATLDKTGLRHTGFKRISGRLDGEISTGRLHFDPDVGHTLFSALPRTDRIASYWHRETLAVPVAAIVVKQMNYDPKRDADGDFVSSVQLKSNRYWLDWCRALTAGKRTDTTATNGTGVDFTAGFSFGLQAYLHVFAFSGTNVTIKLQQSSDNGAGDAFADVTGGAFTVVTGVTKERIETARAQAVERYLRVVTTGTFTSVQFAVAVCVNRSDMTI